MVKVKCGRQAGRGGDDVERHVDASAKLMLRVQSGWHASDGLEALEQLKALQL